jgi:DNA-binding CsgD family transcriptional regulator
MPRRKPNPGLTERERQCAEEIIRGYENKQIGQRLGISYRTVETHRRRIFTKTGCRNAVELLRKMMRVDEEEGQPT